MPMQKTRIYQDGLKGNFSDKRAYKKFVAEKQERAIIKELREAGLRGEIHLLPTKIDLASLEFDEKHINKERSHNVSIDEAKTFIEKALFSETVWRGQFERYYSEYGVAYVKIDNNLIRTANKREEFSENVKKAIGVMKNYGR